MKKPGILLFFLFATFVVFAQEVISTQGDSYVNANGSIDFTVGEVVIDTGTDGNNDLTQGFHQPVLSSVGLEDHMPGYEATIFPNPTDHVLYIRTTLYQGVSYQLYDAQGKILQQQALSSTESSLEVSQLPVGHYFLVLIDKDQNKLKTFNLLKN